MKKIYLFLCATVALLSVASCQEDMINVEQGNNENGYTFSATIGGETRTTLQDNVKVFWAKGDNITVFDADNKPITFTGQQTEAAATADFYAESYNPADKAYAVYPENAEAEFDGDIVAGLHISAEQTAVAGGFDPLSTVAVGEETEKGKLTFKNAHSLVKFTVSGDKMPETVSFTNGGDKAVAGDVAYNVTDKTAYIEDTESASVSVVLKPAAGEEFEAGKTYYIAFCADGDLKDMTLAFDDVVVKEVKGVKEDVGNGRIFDLGTVAFPAEKEMIEVTANYLSGIYFGNLDAEGYWYQLILYEDSEYNTFVSFDIYSETAVGDGPSVVPFGVYEFDPSYSTEPGTMAGAYICYDGEDSDIIGGTMTVTENHIDLVVEAEDGTVYHVTYDGSLEFETTSEGGDSVSNLDGDLELSVEDAYFTAEGYDNEYEGKMYYTIYVYSDPETFAGHWLMLEIISDNMEDITGEYAAVAEAHLDPENIYNCFLAGDYENEEEGIYPFYSWYLDVETLTDDGVVYNKQAPLVEGDILIEKDANGVYTFMLDCYDDAGNSITGVIKGTGEIDID